MTAGKSKSPIVPRRVSDVTPQKELAVTKRQLVGLDESPYEESRSSRKRQRPAMTQSHGHLRRLVSQDFECDEVSPPPPCISSEDEDGPCSTDVISEKIPQTSKQLSHALPLRCVSDAQETATKFHVESKVPSIPPLPNPLQNSKLLAIHIRAVRLEAELYPMRQIVARLMAHPQYNRRAIFNVPVDPVVLGLPDYFAVIKKPMDLGTIKARLHAVAYSSRTEVADDIRLVFQNAMVYNSQENFVHIAAKNLLSFFEESYEVLQAKEIHGQGPAMKTGTAPTITPTPMQVDRNNCGKAMKRALNVAAKKQKHSCRSCRGRACLICRQGCLSHEPALLICTGSNCAGAKIRKGATYYIAKDGTRQFCQRCYANLQAVLPHTSDQIDAFGSSVRYKRDLLRRKNEEEVAEQWINCVRCNQGAHKVCVMRNEHVDAGEDFVCPDCQNKDAEVKSEDSKPNVLGEYCMLVSEAEEPVTMDTTSGVQEVKSDEGIPQSSVLEEFCTFISGSEEPITMSQAGVHEPNPLAAEAIPHTPESRFIENKVRGCMSRTGIPNIEKTVSVRIISDCEKSFNVPEVVRKHFRMPSTNGTSEFGVLPPLAVRYSSKAIALFQKIDGLDVCIFCMYVHEYDCNDKFQDGERPSQKKRVYIAYLDSVEHFRPRVCRTDVYHEMLVSYLATARARGYEAAHIWACPPSRGNSFVFWNHPSSQRTPTKDRLITWYQRALSRAIRQGVVTDVESLFDSSFSFDVPIQKDAATAIVSLESMTLRKEGLLNGRVMCPPLLDGDFWIEEAVRIHGANIVRHLKSKPKDSIVEITATCPASQLGRLVREKIIAHPLSVPFRRPVNAAALNLHDYHRVIKHPMDLGTVHSKCILGEYETLRELVADVELVFTNAMKYNPKGHYVHSSAVDLRAVFLTELTDLTNSWSKDFATCDKEGWESFGDLGMSLDSEIQKRDVAPTPLSPACVSSISSINPPMLNLPLSPPRPGVENLTSQSESQSASQRTENTTLLSPIQEITQSGVESIHGNRDSQLIENVTPPVSPSKVRIPLPNSGRKPSKICSPRTLKKASKALQDLMTNKLELLSGGPDAILQRMVGEDLWLMDKRNPSPAATKKKVNGKRKKDPAEEAPVKRRRQSWLGEELGLSVRRMRTSFFTCSLTAKTIMSEEEEQKAKEFNEYISPFGKGNPERPGDTISSRVADARHALLEFSQFRNLEFDTLRRAKYSTAMILYHLHNDDAPGLVPQCSTCHCYIVEVRWHRVRRVEERHHTGRVPPTLRAARMAQSTVAPGEAEACHKGEELCASCYGKLDKKEDFIPLPVSFKPRM